MPHPLSSRRGGGSQRQHPYQHHEQRQHPYSQNYQQQFSQQGQNYRNHGTAGNGTAMGPLPTYARSEYDYQHQQMSPQRYYENNHFGQRSMSTPAASRRPSSHQPDEEAAAKALIMSAEGRGGSASERRVNVNETDEIKEERKCKDSLDGKVIVDVAHVSPSSNDGLQLHSNSHADDCGDHDSIQDEMNGASMENFPVMLHSLLSSGNHTSVIRWMPDGKVCRIINWHELSNIMPKFFPNMCENRSGKISVMNRMDLFLKEVEVWGFKKEKDLDGNILFSHEFFIKVAPNLTKYLTPRKRIRSLQSVQDEILSPPRIGRLNKQNVNPRPLDSIFCGKRKEQESPVEDENGIVIAAEDNNASDRKGVTSPVTPSFTLANQVSPNSEISPRGRLQSSRGRAKMVSNGAPDMRILFPVSKRGRRSTNVSSRGGRGGGTEFGVRLKYDDQPTPSAIRMFPPRPKPN